MYCILALIVCIGAVAANKCCIPPQWEASSNFLVTVVHNGKAITATGRVAMAYDRVNQKIGQLETIYMDGVPAKSYGVLLDYGSNTKYMINEEGLCYKTVLNRDDMGGCITDNATLIGNSGISGDVMGLGSNSFRMNSYSQNFGDVSVVIGVTADNCIPVMETINGAIDGNPFVQNLHYLNITAGISSPENLQVPPRGCENAVNFESSYTGGNFMAGPVGRRSVLLGL